MEVDRGGKVWKGWKGVTRVESCGKGWKGGRFGRSDRGGRVDRGEEVKRGGMVERGGVPNTHLGCMIAVYPKPNTTHNKGLSSKGSH